MNDLLKEKLPSLLASYQGLYVACACFTMLDAKDRKGVLKTLKDDIKEMFTNKLSYVFLIHVLNSLDDTTLKIKILIRVPSPSLQLGEKDLKSFRLRHFFGNLLDLLLS